MRACPDTRPPRRVRSPRGQGDRLREEILAAAENLLVASGDESALSVRAIAAAVGVTPPSIYIHFADRNELVFAVCARQAEQVDRAMDERASGEPDPLERIRLRGFAYLAWGLANPEHYRILMMGRPAATPARFAGHRVAGGGGLDALAADMSEAAEAGRIRLRHPPRVSAELFWMVVHGMVSMLIAKPHLESAPPQETYQRMFDLVLLGLAPRD
jgi:AcrR family transcriptional regulator